MSMWSTSFDRCWTGGGARIEPRLKGRAGLKCVDDDEEEEEEEEEEEKGGWWGFKDEAKGRERWRCPFEPAMEIGTSISV